MGNSDKTKTADTNGVSDSVQTKVTQHLEPGAAAGEQQPGAVSVNNESLSDALPSDALSSDGLFSGGSLSPEKLVKDSKSLTYDELLHRFESLQQKAKRLPSCETRHVAESLLAGAEELILRQDEIDTDFSIAIIALNEHANRQILAVITKSGHHKK